MKNKYPIKYFLNNTFSRSAIGQYVLPFNDIFEFGVHLGTTLNEICASCSNYDRYIRKVFAFDSFIGLPQEDENTIKHNSWNEGSFSSKKDLGGSTLEETLDILKHRLTHDVTFIPGFYSELNKETIQKYDIKQASLIHIDCDLYISAYQALDFCFSNNLVIPGTIIMYDDWGHPDSFNSQFKEFEYGESKAHKEITQKYNIVWKRLNGYVWEYLA